MDFRLSHSVVVELSQTRVKYFSPPPRLARSVTLSFLLGSFLLLASIFLSVSPGLCYLITLPLYQITEEEHELTQCV